MSSTPLTSFEIWYGRDEPPPEIVKLMADELELEFEEGNLRYIRYAGHELIRSIYVAIRDVNWNTIPAKITNLSVASAENYFHIEYDAFHQDGALVFRWHATIDGKTNGNIEYTMNGVAESDFRYCRIGFCILHPIAGIAGSPYRAITPKSEISGVLPELIEPQAMDESGFEAPIFPSCSSLTVDTPAGISITTDFEGDLFEMEDQRNWTDGSFKTYCTPLALGYPHNARAGQEFYQKVTVKAGLNKDARKTRPPESAKTIRVALGKATDQRLPNIGIGMASHGQDLTASELELLSRLHLDHLKVEIHLQDASWVSELEKAISIAKKLDCPLELAVFLIDDSEMALATLATAVREMPVARLIVFHESEAAGGTTSAHWIQLVRKHLADALPDTPFVGGTNGNFAELNRQQPDISVMDGVAYTINPQVHASDERSLIEAIEAQRDTVVTASGFSENLPICISSVTLKPPFNQAATEEEAPPSPDELPDTVDQRQMSLFAAAWTVGSVRSLAVGGANSITYYETTGWRGLVEAASGSPLPDKFRSFPGMVFPVYWVLAFLADAHEATLLQMKSDMPLLVEGLAFQKNNRLVAIVANLQPQAQEVRLGPLPNGKVSLRRINEDSMATSNPDASVKYSELITIRDGNFIHVLEPYETAIVEIELV